MSMFAALGFPELPRAACRGRYELFDRVIDERRCGPAEKAAIEICRGCKELKACGNWLDSLPLSRKPYGVTAGRIRRISGRNTAA